MSRVIPHGFLPVIPLRAISATYCSRGRSGYAAGASTALHLLILSLPRQYHLGCLGLVPIYKLRWEKNPCHNRQYPVRSPHRTSKCAIVSITPLPAAAASIPPPGRSSGRPQPPGENHLPTNLVPSARLMRVPLCSLISSAQCLSAALQRQQIAP
jgi:hypothetical protein